MDPVQGPLMNCPRCKLDLTRPYEVKASEQDIESFLIAFAEGEPWVREYSLMQGKIKVKVRELSEPEHDILYQLATQQIQGAMQNPRDAMWKLLESMLNSRWFLQIVELNRGGNIISFPKSLEKWQESIDPEKKLNPQQLVLKVKDRFIELTKATESLGRMLLAVVSDFNMRLRDLEVKITTPDFFDNQSAGDSANSSAEG